MWGPACRPETYWLLILHSVAMWRGADERYIAPGPSDVGIC